MFLSGISSTYDVSFYALQKSLSPFGDKEINSIISYSDKSSATHIQKSVYASGFNSRLSDEQVKELEKLKARDAEVRQHEEAHRNAAAGLASPPKYTYKAGPDGKQYAVGGSVDLDTSKAATPEATIAKAGIIRRAALAPKNPSQQDMKVAQEASKMESEARQEMLVNRQTALKAYSEVNNVMKPPVFNVKSPMSGSNSSDNKQANMQGINKNPFNPVTPYSNPYSGQKNMYKIPAIINEPNSNNSIQNIQPAVKQQQNTGVVNNMNTNDQSVNLPEITTPKTSSLDEEATSIDMFV